MEEGSVVRKKEHSPQLTFLSKMFNVIARSGGFEIYFDTTVGKDLNCIARC